jgi:hypothetical protein
MSYVAAEKVHIDFRGCLADKPPHVIFPKASPKAQSTGSSSATYLDG